MVRGQERRWIVTGGIYVNILRITIQAGRGDRAIWQFCDGFLLPYRYSVRHLSVNKIIKAYHQFPDCPPAERLG